jgi:putative membrane protein
MKMTLITITRGGMAGLAVATLCCTGSVLAEEKTTKNDAKPQATSASGSADKDFIIEAAKGGMGEVEMGKVAGQKGKSAEVKSFGKQMVADHSKANNELKALAKKKGIALDVKPDTENFSDSNFDKEYAKEMVKDHEKDVSAFEKETKNGKDADVKAWANKTLPTLKHHLQMSKDLQGKVGK